MKKRFLPFSLLLVIMILGQTMAIADQGGHYVPRKQTNNAEAFMGSLRANQHTGLVDPADMLKAMQTPAMRNAGNQPLYWISMGPDNMGGQTTAVVFDNKSNEVYIGAKGGGVYKSYNFGVTWHQVGDMNLMVSCMVQDADGVIYVGTGDGGRSASYNGLSQQGYDNSFVGTGIYKLVNDVFEPVVTPNGDDWLYVNDIAVAGDVIIAATNNGLKYSSDKGETWHEAVAGRADVVKVSSDNTIVATVDGKLYIGKNANHLTCHSTDDLSATGDTLLPAAAGLLEVGISPSNPNVIYAAGIDGSGVHTSIYVSENKGETWSVVLPSISSLQGHNVFEGFGLNNHGLVVDPSNDGIVYILGYNLWQLQKPESGHGYYICVKLSAESMIYSSDYLHCGLHTMVFNPKNANECYVGTDGGVYKGTGRFSFANCNRNYVTTRMFSVAPSGKDTRVLASGLDHGIVKIEGDENALSTNTGVWINPSGNNMGLFNDDSHGGPSVISTINPNTFIVTYKAGGLARTQTAGEDWVSTNFTSSSSISLSTSSFRTPIILLENYNDDLNPVEVWGYNETGHNLHAGDVLQVMSRNKFPFNYTLEHSLHAGDSILVHDPISAKLFVGFKDAIYMTRTALDFSVETYWYKVADKSHAGFAGEPLGMAVSADGDHLFVGTKEGRFFRLSNLNTVVDQASGTITDSTFAVTTTEIFVPGINDTTQNTQCITSIAVDPQDANKVVITLGNYGNSNYVLYSTNATAEEPVFTAKQGNLPAMPVYASLIEMATGDVILGTERGIYRTKGISSSNPEWTADSHILGEVPVMDLKQQVLFHEDEQTINETEEGTFYTDYPGVHNTGVIYAATYGRGVFRCENYKKDFENVPENEEVNAITVSMYPNPVASQATISFNVEESANVSYQVFDMTGRMVMNQNMGRLNAGEHHVNINAENLSTGNYILRLNQGDNNASVKFLVY